MRAMVSGLGMRSRPPEGPRTPAWQPVAREVRLCGQWPMTAGGRPRLPRSARGGLALSESEIFVMCPCALEQAPALCAGLVAHGVHACAGAKAVDFLTAHKSNKPAHHIP